MRLCTTKPRHGAVRSRSAKCSEARRGWRRPRQHVAVMRPALHALNNVGPVLLSSCAAWGFCIP